MDHPHTPSDSFFQTLGNILKPFSRGNKLWDNARFVLADVPLNAKEAKKILPLGLFLTETPTATLFIADYTKTSFTVPYREAAILIHVRTLFGRGVHCPWMVVDDDTAMIYGRELLGYPKKMAQLSFKEENGVINASVSRRGHEILRFETQVGKPLETPKPVFDMKTFNVGGPGGLFAISPIWMFRPKEEIHESYDAASKVTIGDSISDPIKRLVAGDPLHSSMVVMDILGSRYNLPVGLSGLIWFVRSYALRYL